MTLQSIPAERGVAVLRPDISAHGLLDETWELDKLADIELRLEALEMAKDRE